MERNVFKQEVLEKKTNKTEKQLGERCAIHRT